MNKSLEAVILGVMCFILVIAIVIQINTVNNNGVTVTRNQEESNLRSQVLKMKEKYEMQYTELEKLEKELEMARGQAARNNTELEELEKKIKEYSILAGNVNVQGQGILITLSDGKTEQNLLDVENLLVHAENVLSVVNELKNAGAEAICINDKRIVTTSAISCDGNVIVVNGEKISSPIKISAIGLPELLSTLERPGGTLERFATYGKTVELKKLSNIEIPKYTGVLNFKYASSIK